MNEQSTTGRESEAMTAKIDAISLDQALLDADVAIVRTRDLMLRLVELREQLSAERARNAHLQTELDTVTALYDEIVANKAYRYASKAWALRRALGA